MSNKVGQTYNDLSDTKYGKGIEVWQTQLIRHGGFSDTMLSTQCIGHSGLDIMIKTVCHIMH